MSDRGYGIGGYGVFSNGIGQPSILPPTTNAVFTYRLLGPNNDPIWSNYLSNVEAVGQAILTRLLLFQGTWWESILDGTPWWQSILGTSNSEQKISLLLQNRILGSPYVTGVTNLQVTLNQPERLFTMVAQVQTTFGPTSITFTPQPTAQGIL